MSSRVEGLLSLGEAGRNDSGCGCSLVRFVWILTKWPPLQLLLERCVNRTDGSALDREKHRFEPLLLSH